MKKIRGDKPIVVIIHIYMGISQGNSLCSYLYLKQAKMSFFSFLPSQNWTTGGWNRSCRWWRGQQDGGGGREKRYEGESSAKMCTHTC
jgi:hypothetical protein